MVFLRPFHDALLALIRERGNGFQSPLLIRYALQGLVTVERDLLLPRPDGSFVLLPGYPCRAGFEGEFVEEGERGGGLGGEGFAVYERAARGDGEEEESHVLLAGWRTHLGRTGETGTGVAAVGWRQTVKLVRAIEIETVD